MTERKNAESAHQFTYTLRIIALYIVPSMIAYSLVGSVIYGGGASVINWDALKSAGLASLAGGIVQDVLPRSFKEILVFWRFTDRLPGCRAFVNRSHDRYDLNKIKNIDELSALPGYRQQQVFYKTYLKHSDNSAVSPFCFQIYCVARHRSHVFSAGLCDRSHRGFPVTSFRVGSCRQAHGFRSCGLSRHSNCGAPSWTGVCVPSSCL